MIKLMRQKKAPIDYQLEYMEHLFFSIKHKKTESYVIHCIWDKLDDTRIRFEIQQPIKLPNGKTVLGRFGCHNSASSLK